MNWIRVTRQDRCPICNHDSWCTYNEDVVICMRVPSSFEKQFKDGSVGWIHKQAGAAPSRYVPPPKPEPTSGINAFGLMQEFTKDTSPTQIDALAGNLGVSVASLRQLRCAYAKPHHAYAFPMFDQGGNVVGIRLRSIDGRKWAVRGSRQGIFLPHDDPSEKLAFVCEGPTDTAAALTLGLYAVGRPHCSGGIVEICKTFKRCGIREAVIVADNDDPGLRGAEALRQQLQARTAILVLPYPCKDLRAFVNKGLLKQDLMGIITNLAWRPSATPTPGWRLSSHGTCP